MRNAIAWGFGRLSRSRVIATVWRRRAQQAGGRNRAKPPRTLICLAGLCGVLLVAASALAYLPKEVEHGKQVFAAQCALCHGSDARGGQVPSSFPGYAGMKVPALVGRGALPHMANAENIFAFIKQHMPLNKPGTLADRDALDIVTFLVNANNIAKPGTQPMAPEALRSIKLGKL